MKGYDVASLMDLIEMVEMAEQSANSEAHVVALEESSRYEGYARSLHAEHDEPWLIANCEG